MHEIEACAISTDKSPAKQADSGDYSPEGCMRLLLAIVFQAARDVRKGEKHTDVNQNRPETYQNRPKQSKKERAAADARAWLLSDARLLLRWAGKDVDAAAWVEWVNGGCQRPAEDVLEIQ